MSVGMPSGPDILTIANDYRAALISIEESVTAEVLAAYEGIRERLEGDLTALTSRIQARINAGQDVPVSWLHRQDRYQQLLDQAETEVARLADSLGPRLSQAQADAVLLGDEAARSMLGTSGVRVTARLPNAALVELVGRLSDGSPLSDLLDELGPDARGRIERSLTDAVARGINPRRISREVSDALGGNMARAMRITRTEMISSFRNANLAQYREHGDVLIGWRWSAALDGRTCASCLAQHGKVFPLSEPFASHPSCRCSPVPHTGSGTAFPTGPDWFSEQPASLQLQVLGPSKYRAYRDGAISLEDLVETGTDPRWGPWSREKALSRAIAPTLADQYYAEAAG